LSDGSEEVKERAEATEAEEREFGASISEACTESECYFSI
jgi:hypothetical protein